MVDENFKRNKDQNLELNYHLTAFFNLMKNIS